MKVTEQPTADFIDASTIDIASDIVDETFRITVVTPFLYEAMQQNFPVLYILDGVICLPVASSIVLSLQVNAFGVAPPVICVGISYATDNPFDIFSLRTRDLTPTEGTLPPSPVPTTHGTGGAPKFLEALTNEIIPTVEERWSVDRDERCLVGSSLGGLFGLYTLFNRPDAFAKYLLVSPSIWWDDETILRDEERYASSHDDLRAKVFASVGEREETVPARMWPQPDEELYDFAMKARMVSALGELVATLRRRRYPGLDLASHVFEDEHHVTVFPAAFGRGFQTLCV